jgi:4-amino-4-deoxy-L-arabinose transferase-like glycosyltransferase
MSTHGDRWRRWPRLRARWRSLDRAHAYIAALMVAGLVLRVLYVLTHTGIPVTGDGVYYHAWARLLTDGHPFVDPTAAALGTKVAAAPHPPAWPVVLAPVSLLGFDGLLAHQLWAALVGTATVGVVGLTGRRVAGARAGVIAAAVAAVHPGFWMYERVLLSETLVLLLTALCLYAAYGFWSRPGWRTAVTTGASCGLLALTRAEAVLLVPLLLVPLVWLRREVDRPTRARWLGVAVAAALATIAPWAIYNSARFEHPVFLTTSLGQTVVSANCADVYSGPHIGWWSYGCLVEATRAAGGAGDESSIDLAMRRRALDYASAHAGRLPAVVLAREGRTWGLFQPLAQASLDSLGGPSFDVTVLGLGAYWLLVPAAVAGGVHLRRRRVPVLPMLAMMATVVVATALTFGQTRYRALAEVPIVLLAAAAIDSWLREPAAERPEVAEVSAPAASVTAPVEPREPAGASAG